MPRLRKHGSPFRYFNSSPEVIRLVVMMHVRFPLGLRDGEDVLAERGIDICHETGAGCAGSVRAVLSEQLHLNLCGAEETPCQCRSRRRLSSRIGVFCQIQTKPPLRWV